MSSSTIRVTAVSKTFRTVVKPPGVLASIKSLFQKKLQLKRVEIDGCF